MCAIRSAAAASGWRLCNVVSSIMNSGSFVFGCAMAFATMPPRKLVVGCSCFRWRLCRDFACVRQKPKRRFCAVKYAVFCAKRSENLAGYTETRSVFPRCDPIIRYCVPDRKKKGKCIRKLQEITRNFQGTPAPNSSSRPFRRLRARTHAAAHFFSATHAVVYIPYSPVTRHVH
jgi:hypothetical protein